MDLELTDDQRDLQGAVAALLARECPPSLVRAVVEGRLAGSEGAAKELDALFAKMAELDWPAIGVPEAEGGLGLGFVETVLLAEQLGRAVAPGPLFPTVSQFVPAILASADAEQRERFLRPVARGESKGTLAFAERPASFAPEDVRAVARPDGDAFVLSGTKDYVMEASGATEIVVAARLEGTSGRDGLSLFAVPRSALDVVPTVSLDTSRELSTVSMRGVRVGPDRVLGAPGSSAGKLEAVLCQAAVALAAEIVGTCQSILDMVVTHVSSREQFGVKIGSFQAVKHKAANMYVAVESARALTYFAAAAIAENDERAGLAASMAKAAAGDCQELVAEEGIQCLGGIGYTWEHDMHMFVKRAKTGALLLGSAAEHRERVARLIGL
ncbi:MAG: acyl-CoA dehydrogenase family protein [Acidimicrobiales bacterium]